MRACVYCKTRYEKGSSVTFHKFPSDNTLKLWLKNMKLVNWTPKTHDYLCSKHFTDDCFIRHQSRTTLKKCSIPTIFFETDSSLAAAQAEMSKDDNLGYQDDEMNVDKSNSPVHSKMNPKKMLPCETSTTAVASTSYNISQCSTPKRPRTLAESCASIKLDHRYENTPKSSKKEFERVKRALKMSQDRVKVLSQRVKRLKICVSTLRTVIADLKKKKLVCDDCAYMLNQYDDFKLELFKRMAKNTKRAKYAPELRSFAITLHFYSPKAYAYVRNKFNLCLPHPRVIRSWYSSIDANPGFSVESFNALRLKSEVAKQKGEKLICALIIDEMSLKKSCTRSRDGVIRGHVDLGIDSEGNDLPECKDALVFMVVPLNSNWKLPIAYFFIKGLTAETKSALINQALIRLHDVSVEICSLTLDGPPEHFSAVAKLGAELETRMATKPYFFHPVNKEHKVHVIFDPCHMLKNVRNCLGDLKVLKDDKGDLIKWVYIENLAKLQDTEGLRLGNKLKNLHVNYKKIIMKVYLAAQTLSSSVADAIEFCDKILKLPEFNGSSATVRFIRAVDRIFDFLNVRNPWGRGFKSPLRINNENRWRSKAGAAVP